MTYCWRESGDEGERGGPPPPSTSTCPPHIAQKPGDILGAPPAIQDNNFCNYNCSNDGGGCRWGEGVGGGSDGGVTGAHRGPAPPQAFPPPPLTKQVYMNRFIMHNEREGRGAGGMGLVRGRVYVGGDSVAVGYGLCIRGSYILRSCPLRHGVPPTRGYYAVYYAERKMCRQASSQ